MESCANMPSWKVKGLGPRSPQLLEKQGGPARVMVARSRPDRAALSYGHTAGSPGIARSAELAAAVTQTGILHQEVILGLFPVEVHLRIPQMPPITPSSPRRFLVSLHRRVLPQTCERTSTRPDSCVGFPQSTQDREDRHEPGPVALFASQLLLPITRTTLENHPHPRNHHVTSTWRSSGVASAVQSIPRVPVEQPCHP